MKMQRVVQAIGVTSGLLLVLFLLNLGVVRDPDPPRGDVQAMASWLTRHPADWLTSSRISYRALDTSLPRRVALWKAAHQHAVMLAPLRPNTAAGFVRAGLFHWYELDEPERRQVLTAATSLLRDPARFASMYEPLWQLTKDFDYLRRAAPDTAAAADALRRLAIANGLFAEYRELRDTLRKKQIDEFRTRRDTATVADLLSLVPQPLDAADEPLVRSILDELERRTIRPEEAHHRIAPLIEYALRHRLSLEALRPIIASDHVAPALRARLAVALNDLDAATRIEAMHSVGGKPEWRAYYLDRARLEARNGNAAAASLYLERAGVDDGDPVVLATAEHVATVLGRVEQAEAYRLRLRTAVDQGRNWSGTCGPNELCRAARAHVYTAGPGDDIRVAAETIQSDEVPPYIEIYVDDVLAAEGTVDENRTFSIGGGAGIHEVEVRLVNERTRNGAQRRVRLS